MRVPYAHCFMNFHGKHSKHQLGLVQDYYCKPHHKFDALDPKTTASSSIASPGIYLSIFCAHFSELDLGKKYRTTWYLDGESQMFAMKNPMILGLNHMKSQDVCRNPGLNSHEFVGAINPHDENPIKYQSLRNWIAQWIQQFIIKSSTRPGNDLMGF